MIKKINRITIQTKPRIHISLIGMNSDGYRINGGVGFALDDPSITLSIKKADSFSITDLRSSPFTNEECNKIGGLIANLKESYNFPKNVSITVHGKAPTHSGLGTSTQVRIGCVEGLFVLNNHSANSNEIAQISGRGGASGIGINSYFNGGFVFDLGIKNVHQMHLPSHQAENRANLPLLLQSLPMPSWNVGICIPNNIAPKTEAQELDFFRATCPIPSNSVFETAYHSVFGLLASVKEHDFETFCEAIKKIQLCAWKKAERNQYGEDLLIIENALYQCGASAVGMSSMGPLLYFLANDVEQVARKAKKATKSSEILITSTSNTGRIISYA